MEIANDTLYGLGAGVWSRSGDLAYRAGRAIQAGRVWTNTYHGYFRQVLLFGGYKLSGIGRENHAMMFRNSLSTNKMFISAAMIKMLKVSSKRSDSLILVERVVATEEALQLINSSKRTHGSIMFYQIKALCKWIIAPMCYKEDDFKTGDSDVYLGSIGGTPFYIHKMQYEYWKHTQLILDATDGRGAAFSLDSIEDRHFITNSRVFTDEEYAKLKNQIEA